MTYAPVVAKDVEEQDAAANDPAHQYHHHANPHHHDEKCHHTSPSLGQISIPILG